MQQAEVQRLAIRAAIWKAIISARVESEGDVRRSVKFLGDVAFLRNIRGMIEAGVPVADLIDEVAQRSFNGIWPFQLVSAARALKQKQSRGRTSWPPCPQALPVLDAIFQRVMASMLPRKEDGTLYSILGMADVSSSMMIKLGGKASSATCMDTSLSFVLPSVQQLAPLSSVDWLVPGRAISGPHRSILRTDRWPLLTKCWQAENGAAWERKCSHLSSVSSSGIWNIPMFLVPR